MNILINMADTGQVFNRTKKLTKGKNLTLKGQGVALKKQKVLVKRLWIAIFNCWWDPFAHAKQPPLQGGISMPLCPCTVYHRLFRVKEDEEQINVAVYANPRKRAELICCCTYKFKMILYRKQFCKIICFRKDIRQERVQYSILVVLCWHPANYFTFEKN